MHAAKTALSVNLNKVALLRNARDLDVPSVERAARTCLDAGADGLTVHPRPDRRHIRPSDVVALAELLADTDAEFNIEGNPFAGAESGYPGFVELVARASDAGGVAQCTLVPDAPGQRTSDHGWDLGRDGDRLRPLVERLKGYGCRISLFMDADADAMAAAAAVGADRIELYTEPYAQAFADGDASASLARFAAAAEAAHAAGLGVNAGHDLSLDNLGPFVAAVPHVLEVSIGHALTADALWLGLDAAVRAYQRVLRDVAVAA
ncbi:MAG: pyridoxine 5'-phosphate synthase [Rhodothermales bacterium]